MGNMLLGAKYYRYTENDEIEIYRVYKYNDLEAKLYNDKNREDKIKLKITDLEKEFVRLNPHAVVNFCIVKVGNDLDDVIVTVHKTSDLYSNEPTPVCVCRQNITDLFGNQIRVSEKLYVGCCVSLETCPPDIDYRVMIACDGINKNTSVCAYMDDTLDDILSFVKTKEYDNTLQSLFVDHVKYAVSKMPVNTNIIKNRLMALDSHDGYCKTLRLLLEHNNFMYDFYRSFGIIPLNVKIEYDDENVVQGKVIEAISDIYNVNIVSNCCIPYWYDIELSDIQNDYVLIMDSEDKLYIVLYYSSGQRHINIEKVESEENIERMSNTALSNDKSVKEAVEYIRINKNKYN